MHVRTGSYTSVPAAAVFAGLTLVLVACALPSPAANDQKPRLSNNGSAICPNGWLPAATSSQDVKGQNLCVRVQEQMFTWTRARQDCRASKGFLIKLDSILNVDNLQLNEYLKSRGLDTVWTGMHHEHGTLMWDELQPRMVKAYYGKTQANGWKKRDWEFNFDSFKLKADTCGKFEVHEENSSEMFDNQAANRTRRSPQRPIDNRGAQRLRGLLQKRQRTGLDNEEVAPSRSPIEEKIMDTSQSSLSQGLQEGVPDNVGDISNAGDTNTQGNADPSNGPQVSLGKTTVRSITATDLSNFEDVDDPLLATKRSSRRPTTKDKVTNATTISANSSMSWKNTTQGNAKSSPLPMKSSRTTPSPRSSTSVDDLLSRLLKSSLDSSPNSDVSGSVDTSSNSDRLDPTLTPGNDSVEPPVVESAPITDSQSGNRDTSDDMTSGNPSLNNSLNIDLTDTSDPHNTDTNNDLPINATSFTTTTASVDSATETANSIRNRHDPQKKISRKTIAATLKFVTQMPRANRTVSASNNTFPNTSVMPSLFPTTTSKGSLTKDSHNMDAPSNDSPSARLARKRVKGFTGNRRSKTTTTKRPIHAMTTPRLSPSAGAAAAAIAAAAITTTTTTSATSTTRTTIKLSANHDGIASNGVPNHSTTSNGNLSSTPSTTTKHIPIMTIVGVSTSTLAATTKNIPVMSTVDIPTSTVAALTRNIPIMTTVEMPTSTVAATTRTIPIMTTVDISTSTVAATKRNIPIMSTVDKSTSTVAATTRNIPIMSTVDKSTSTVATTTRNIPIMSTVDKPTSTVDATTRNIPPMTKVDIPTSTVAATTTNIPTMTTVDIPISTVAATTRNIPIMSTVDKPTSTVAASTRNIPNMSTLDKPTSTVAATTRNIPIVTAVDIPTSTVAATTRNIPIMTTADKPTSTVAASKRNIPNMTAVDIPTSTVAATTRNIPIVTAVDIPTSTVAATTRNIPNMTAADVPTSTIAATTIAPLTSFTSSHDDITKNHTKNSLKDPTSKVFSKRSTTNIPIVTTGMPISTVSTNHLPTSAANKYLDSGQAVPINPEPLIGKVLHERSTTTKVPVMTTTPDLPMSVIANTTPLTTFTANEDLFTKQSILHDFESSSSKRPSTGPKTTTNSPATTATHLQILALATTATTTNTTARLISTADQDFITSKSTPRLSNPPTGKIVSKRSTTNIPVMTTTDLPTSTMATTPVTSFASQPNLTTSPAVTTPVGAKNSRIMNTSNTSLSAVAPNTQATTDTPVVIVTAENMAATALVTTNATSQVDNTTTTISGSSLQLTETPILTNTTITNTPPLFVGITNNTGPTLNPKTPGTDDSSEVTDHTDPPPRNSSATSVPRITTTPGITDSNSKEMDLDSALSSTETSGSVDLDVRHSSNTTRNSHFLNTGLDSSSSTSSEAFDKATNVSSISNHALGHLSANGDVLKTTTGKAGSEKADTVKDNKANSQRDSTVRKSQSVSDVLGGNSSSTEEPTKDTSFHVPVDLVSLSHCEEEHASVCVTEAVEELSLVGHCDRNWYGHRLLDRCYKPVDYMLKAIEARQNCLRYSATLATVDTGFYGNVTALLLNYFAPGSRAWVDASLNLEVPDVGQCAALGDGQLHSVDCNLRLPFICQKDVRFSGPSFEDGMDARGPMLYVQNLTSFHPQTLWCPLRMSAFDDVILWFKDGRPIVDQDDDDGLSFRPANGHMPNRLDIDLSILEHLGEGGARIPKPAMLQGLYWCEIFRREPFKRVVSYKIFLKFTDVITLYGHVTTKPVNHVTAAIFNRMGRIIGLPALLERRLATLNKNITHFMRRVFPIVRDIIPFIQRTNPDTGRSEFTTYICLATGDLGSRLRGSLVDLYISAFYDSLVRAEDELHKEWNLTLPIRQAVALTMADMCPEANLVDRTTGLSATFPSTTVNNFATSRDMCDGAPTGSAFCKGDLQSGAFWDTWQVTNPCHNFILQPPPNKPGSVRTHTPLGAHKLDETNGNRANVGDVFGAEKPAKPDLVELNHLPVNKDNLIDVSDRLADVINHAEDLSALDIETIAQVVHKIVSVDKLTSKISDKLVKTVNFVLDASEGELRKAEQSSNAPSRLLADLETFGEKANMGVDNWMRYVTPNVAMEMWNLQDSSDVVIGFGAKQAFSWTAPLSEPRIQTIKDRMWAEQYLSSFDVAIQLPESLVKSTVQYSHSSLRLTMLIYRKTGLFVGSQEPGTGHRAVNSAIISASLGGRKIYGLDDKVRLVFKPFKEPRNGHRSTQCVFWDTETNGSARWSSAGCVYNGTVNGRTVCLCDHLTNFAILTDFYGDRSPISQANETALTVLTIIGLILSILGLAITIITFLAFKKLRQGRAQQTLFNMSIALLCFQTTFLIGVKQTSVMPVCLAVSVLLHYFILVSFAWMLIEAVLQYLTFVKVLGTYVSRYTLKTVVPAWGLPLLPVIAVLATDYRLYLGRAHYCWMDLQAFYYAFALPVGIIIVFNIIMFFIIIMSLATKPKGLRSNQNNTSARKTSLKAAITIFVLLGLTWIFGYLAIEDARLPFQYAFTILSSLQGFLIFMLMVARRKQVRDQWEIMCCLKWKQRQNKQKKLSPTMSTSTTCSSSNSHGLPTFTNDSIILSSSTGSRRKDSLHI